MAHCLAPRRATDAINNANSYQFIVQLNFLLVQQVQLQPFLTQYPIPISIGFLQNISFVITLCIISFKAEEELQSSRHSFKPFHNSSISNSPGRKLCQHDSQIAKGSPTKNEPL